MLDFKMHMPFPTDLFIAVSRWTVKYAWFLPMLWMLAMAAVNWVAFSSWAKWYCPLVNRVYRPGVRGQFLHTLGLMLETGKPLPRVLDRVLESDLLPSVVACAGRRN